MALLLEQTRDKGAPFGAPLVDMEHSDDPLGAIETDAPNNGIKLLVGTDFSACATAALARAFGFRERLGGVVEIMHVLPPVDSEKRELDAKGNLWLEEVGVDPDSVTLRRGIPWIELTRRARVIGATLVIVGVHGCSGRQPLALGSTASRLAMASPCPVLLVKTSVSFGDVLAAPAIESRRTTTTQNVSEEL